jgi:phospholipid-binding lipoprotein MlaA
MMTAMAASPTRAAPVDAAQGTSSPTIFVDLTPQGSATPKSAVPGGDAAVPAGSSMMFIDLTTGAAPAAMPAHNIGAPTKAPRTRLVDLRNGASPPPEEQAEAEPEIPAPETTIITITADRLRDPYEETNRGRFRAHVRLHHYVIDPVERAYIYIVPEPARAGVHNFLTNLDTPTVFANDVLQGNVGRAGDTISRFVINSTLGIAGIFDVAGMAGIRYRDDDFGATLATYGVGDYPYLLIPVIGPSNPRDLSGKIVDIFLDPFRFVTLPGGIISSIGRGGVHEVDKRTDEVGELDELARSSSDPYAAERSMALEKRRAEIEGNPAPSVPPGSVAIRGR